jgi:hypothetical protein
VLLEKIFLHIYLALNLRLYVLDRKVFGMDGLVLAGLISLLTVI